MEKANYPKMLLAVIVGITGALLLILNIWGAQWYKIVVSILLGTISGLLIADYKISINILKTAMEELISIVIISTIIRNSGKDRQIIKKSLLFFINVLFLLAIMTILFLLLFFSAILAAHYHYEILVALTAIILIASGFIIVLLLQSCYPENWRKELTKEEMEIIWGKFFHNKLSPNFLIRVCPDMNLIRMEKAIFRSAAITLNKKSKKLFGDLYEGLVIIFFFLIFVVIDLILYFIGIIRKIGDNGYPLLVSASIVGGSLAGVITQSLFYGVLGGISLFSASYLSAKLIKNLSPFYLVRKTFRRQ